MRRSVGTLAGVILLCGFPGAGVLCAETRQSLVLNPGVAAESLPVPGTPAYRAVKDLRVEFRLHNYAAPPEWSAVLDLPDFLVRFVASALLLHVSDKVDQPGKPKLYFGALGLKAERKTRSCQAAFAAGFFEEDHNPRDLGYRRHQLQGRNHADEGNGAYRLERHENNSRRGQHANGGGIPASVFDTCSSEILSAGARRWRSGRLGI